MRLRPTRRGYAVVAVVVGGVAAGAVFGARALDAVVLPGVVALVAAVVQVRRGSAPTGGRTLSPAGGAAPAGVARDCGHVVPATLQLRT